jgi:dTDP-4-dehydrorhamnose 3,5-epimerase
VTVTETGLPGVLLVVPATHGDARGFFRECYHAPRYAAAAARHGAPGLAGPFVQENH